MRRPSDADEGQPTIPSNQNQIESIKCSFDGALYDQSLPLEQSQDN